MRWKRLLFDWNNWALANSVEYFTRKVIRNPFALQIATQCHMVWDGTAGTREPLLVSNHFDGLWRNKKKKKASLSIGVDLANCDWASFLWDCPCHTACHPPDQYSLRHTHTHPNHLEYSCYSLPAYTAPLHHRCCGRFILIFLHAVLHCSIKSPLDWQLSGAPWLIWHVNVMHFFFSSAIEVAVSAVAADQSSKQKHNGSQLVTDIWRHNSDTFAGCFSIDFYCHFPLRYIERSILMFYLLVCFALVYSKVFCYIFPFFSLLGALIKNLFSELSTSELGLSNTTLPYNFF